MASAVGSGFFVTVGLLIGRFAAWSAGVRRFLWWIAWVGLTGAAIYGLSIGIEAAREKSIELIPGLLGIGAIELGRWWRRRAGVIDSPKAAAEPEQPDLSDDPPRPVWFVILFFAAAVVGIWYFSFPVAFKPGTRPDSRHNWACHL